MDLRAPLRLDRYLDHRARYRELVLLRGACGSVLVVDRLCESADDTRLVAHLAADEPASNALLVCHEYLSDPGARWCRRLSEQDLVQVPAETRPPAAQPGDRALVDREGNRHRVQRVAGTHRTVPELRWVREPPAGREGSARVVSLRAVIAAVEDYDPARAMSVQAAARAREEGRRGCSVVTLMAEVQRVDISPIVLNRGLREAVLHAVDHGLSLSAIAIRCGRVKRDRRGNVSGETSWLGRRLGLLPEGNRRHPTPWVHSDVLALIARRGLGLCPREVELG
jgi:hypothetical protein